MMSRSARGRVIAVLGPTNTGKTHLALDRMLGHQSGMIGFPLRLLARENYDRVVRLKGRGSVALLTGEEKIVPPHPNWFVCTTESMPVDRRVDFLAVDEIQLCADPDRGHMFTDRLLHARGESETMFLGAETIKPLLRRLVPGVEFIARPRFSQLRYSGPQKLTRLPPRSVVVAFSASDVYAVAELLRRQRGGAAVVLGALSPRTRNAQVGLYQAGEVDYLVATDAIGMGLNMDVDHVAFAALRKFDGRLPRALEAAELAQIAGRAGRHMNDGTFGTTGDIGGLEPAIVDAVENHTFPTLKRLQWRNSDLRFISIDALLAALARLPDRPGLVRAREADDQLALQALAADPVIAGATRSPDRVRLLWDVCQIPDFRKSLAEQHSRLLASIYRHLSGPAGQLPAAWLDAQVRRLERTDGDIDTLITRIANVRTWTYVSYRADWVPDAAAWQERTRAIEDRLSDALHDRLTQRFIDRRTAVLVKKLKGSDTLLSAVGANGDVHIEGHFVGRLHGLKFHADQADGMHAARAVAAAAQRALRHEIARRVAAIEGEPDTAFAIDEQGIVRWRSAPVARLAPGPRMLRPSIEMLPTELIETAARGRVERRLAGWLTDHLAAILAPLFAALDAPLTGAARGLAFQLGEALGSLPRRPAEAQVASLSPAERTVLARLGIRLGVESVFLPALLRPGAQRLRATLWSTFRGRPPGELPPAGRVALTAEADVPADFYEAIGFRRLAALAVRVDMLERFAAQIRKLARQGQFTPSPALLSMLGITADDAAGLLVALGYLASPGDQGVTYSAMRRRTCPSRPRRRRGDPRETSPFAVLRRNIPA
jgi:ATP-dependent RNA helicase SUPV3L1/SUV3